MNKPTKEELILLHEMMCKASRHFDEVIKKERKKHGGSPLAIELFNIALIDQNLVHKKVQEMCADWVLENWDVLSEVVK